MRREDAEPGVYTNAEIAALSPAERDGFPVRGVRCRKCGAVVPEFADLTAEVGNRAREVWRTSKTSEDSDEALRLLTEATGCSERWAKIWLLHPNGADISWTRDQGGPCPKCGKRLRTEQARQCFHCGAEWR